MYNVKCTFTVKKKGGKGTMYDIHYVIFIQSTYKKKKKEMKRYKIYAVGTKYILSIIYIYIMEVKEGRKKKERKHM